MCSSRWSVAAFLFVSLPAAGATAADLRADPGGPYTVAAEGTVRLDASDSNVSGCTRVQYSWDVGSDGDFELGPSSAPATSWVAEGVDGEQVLTVVLLVSCTSGSLTSEDKASTQLTVENVDPVIETFEVATGVLEGSEAGFSVTFSDVEAADTLSVAWDLGDGQVEFGSSVAHTYEQDGEYTVSVAVTDDDGGRDTRTQRIVVENAAPVIQGEPGSQAWPGEVYSFEPGVSDSGVLDVHTWSGELPLGLALDASTGAISWVPTAEDVGSHDLVLTVRDEGGGSDSLSWSVQVGDGADGGSTDGGSAGDGGNEDRPWGDGNADPDPWDEVWPVEGEGCRCGSSSAGLLLPAVLPLLALRRRRRTD